MDMKQWIFEKAQELASELYEREYYDLPPSLQELCYNKAVELFSGFIANMIDDAIEKRKWRQCNS